MARIETTLGVINVEESLKIIENVFGILENDFIKLTEILSTDCGKTKKQEIFININHIVTLKK